MPQHSRSRVTPNTHAPPPRSTLLSINCICDVSNAMSTHPSFDNLPCHFPPASTATVSSHPNKNHCTRIPHTNHSTSATALISHAFADSFSQPNAASLNSKTDSTTSITQTASLKQMHLLQLQ
ncbi:hypothetical protein ETH_00004030 [Eimeria tenella]|uniref:Uncharacterized protein n=1 Tax=Eimeria tenella TaxID=5802 RepID=U6LB76_EIMTE|nr:hypothetical protein ETH_00004030 [Eimeria tenella]CDJ45005.1 hypothetical protein ETH_00004030 [Eimeria tenella]|eukprot:XP_013235752.1 hypothetical protein ETH_00004030 [Eimeria tenella]